MKYSRWHRIGLVWVGVVASIGTSAAWDVVSWETAYTSGARKLRQDEIRRQRPIAATPPGEKRDRTDADTGSTAKVASGTKAKRATKKTPDEAELIALAESVIATHQAAVEAGSTGFVGLTSIDQVVRVLGTGVRGGGKFTDTVFHVPGLDADRQPAVTRRLAVSQGLLVLATSPAPETRAADAGAPAVPEDGRRLFADGQLKVAVPPGFEAEPAGDDDLLLRTDGATLRLHLEKRLRGLDAWGAVRLAAERIGKGVNMSGSKVYLMAPARRRPETVTIGFGESIVSIRVETEPGSPGADQVRFALPGIIESLAAP